jgi:hypothetical protein
LDAVGQIEPQNTLDRRLLPTPKLPLEERHLALQHWSKPGDRSTPIGMNTLLKSNATLTVSLQELVDIKTYVYQFTLPKL